MKTVNKTVLVLHSAQQMCDLVNAVDAYQAFLPWCDHSHFIEQSDDGYSAEIGIEFAGLTQQFSTRNTTRVDDQGVHHVTMQLVDGPFSNMHGGWTFAPLGDEDAARVTFELHYAFSSKTLAMVVGPVFDKIANSLVEAFVKRADQVYADA